MCNTAQVYKSWNFEDLTLCILLRAFRPGRRTIIKASLRNEKFILARSQDADTRVADIRKGRLWIRPSPVYGADAPKAHWDAGYEFVRDCRIHHRRAVTFVHRPRKRVAPSWYATRINVSKMTSLTYRYWIILLIERLFRFAKGLRKLSHPVLKLRCWKSLFVPLFFLSVIYFSSSVSTNYREYLWRKNEFACFINKEKDQFRTFFYLRKYCNLFANNNYYRTEESLY